MKFSIKEILIVILIIVNLILFLEFLRIKFGDYELYQIEIQREEMQEHINKNILQGNKI
jgi:regulatory protein YycI of two-component signal transduction system YycFG